MKPMKQISLLFLLTHILLGCESSGTGEQVDIPPVRIECDTVECMGAPGIHRVVVNFTLSGCAVDQIELYPVVVGDADVTCIGTGCTGTVSSWRDTNANSVTQIESRVYSVCAHINLDNITGKSVNDEYAEENLLISSSSTLLTLSTWGADNYRIQKPRQSR
jgi:hypothetical protein